MLHVKISASSYPQFNRLREQSESVYDHNPSFARHLYLSFDYGVIVIQPDRALVVGDGECEDLPVDFVLTPHETEELDNAPGRQSHAVGSICST